MSTESDKQEASITLVNGQRIRVRAAGSDPEYDDVQVRRSQVKSKNSKQQKPNEKESECNRFKSILKKPTTTFSDTDSNSREHSPSPARKTGSHFYLPMPGHTPRKKVQFLVENELKVTLHNEFQDNSGNTTLRTSINTETACSTESEESSTKKESDEGKNTL